MTSRSFDSRKAAAAFAKRVSKENKTTVRLIEKEEKYFVEGEYPSSDQFSMSGKAESAIQPAPTTLDYDTWIKERGFEKSEIAEEQWWQAYQSSKQKISGPVAVIIPDEEIVDISERNISISLKCEEESHQRKTEKSPSGAGNSISEALKAAYISNGLPPPKPIVDNSKIGSSAAGNKQKKRKNVPLKERGLSTLKRSFGSTASEKSLEKKRKIEEERNKLLAKRLYLESLENRVTPQPSSKLISTYYRGTVVSESTKQRGNSVCPRCGGDGGVNGGCGKCDGTGWV